MRIILPEINNLPLKLSVRRGDGNRPAAGVSSAPLPSVTLAWTKIIAERVLAETCQALKFPEINNVPLKLARYGVVGDLFKILPALNAEFKKRLGK